MWIETCDYQLVNLDFVRTLAISHGSVVCNVRKEHVTLNYQLCDADVSRLLSAIKDAIADGALTFSVPQWVVCNCKDSKK